LQEVALCHRNISLETILFNGNVCTLSSLEWAIRIPKSSDGTNYLLEPQPLGGPISLQFCSPELLNEEAFDGYASDLWSAGLTLFVMLFGIDALFTAPVLEDKSYKDICIDNNLRNFVTKWEKQHNMETSATSSSTSISESAIDLLQNMLRANPNERLTLSEVLQYDWVASRKIANGEATSDC
jgi:serine/threonine protein kinase